MRRREFIAGLGSAATWPVVAPAYQRERTRRIGVLMPRAIRRNNCVFILTIRRKPLTTGCSMCGLAYVESGISPSVATELTKRGHRLILGRWRLPGHPFRDKKNGADWGASEMRKDGEAIGYQNSERKKT